MVQASFVAKKKATKAKKEVKKFVVDCSTTVADNIMDTSRLEKFFQDRIKVDGKTSNLQERIQVTSDKAKIYVTAELPFSKRYLKYLTKKYLRKQQLRDYLRVMAVNKTTYQLGYFDINGGDAM